MCSDFKLYYNTCMYFLCMHAKSLQSCLTLFNPMDCNPPGSSVHGIFQTRILEWVAISYSGGSSRPRNQIGISGISWMPEILCHCATWETHSICDLSSNFSEVSGAYLPLSTSKNTCIYIFLIMLQLTYG